VVKSVGITASVKVVASGPAGTRSCSKSFP
jgi:hypothetical protein